jgi:hypothetical protein
MCPGNIPVFNPFSYQRVPQFDQAFTMNAIIRPRRMRYNNTKEMIGWLTNGDIAVTIDWIEDW